MNDFYDPEQETFSEDFEQEYIDLFGSKQKYELFCKKINDQKITNCEHENQFEENGINICRDCGEQFIIISNEPEWTYYGNSDNRSYRDPSRCHHTKGGANSLDKVLNDRNIILPDSLKKEIEKRVYNITGGKTTRGDRRLAYIAACHFYISQEFGDNRTADDIRKMYNIEKKKMSKGITEYLFYYKNSATKQLTPKDLIRRVLNKTGIQFSHYQKILQLANAIEDKSPILSQSQPQSVAASIVYLYLCMNPEYKHELGLNKVTFSQKVDLSDMTVNKLLNEASKIIGIVVNDEK